MRGLACDGQTRAVRSDRAMRTHGTPARSWVSSHEGCRNRVSQRARGKSRRGMVAGAPSPWPGAHWAKGASAGVQTPQGLARIIHDLVSSDDPLFRATGAPGPRAKGSSRDCRLRGSLLPQTFGLWSSGISRRQRYSCIANVSFVHPEDEIVTPDRRTAKGKALCCSSRNDLMNKPG